MLLGSRDGLLALFRYAVAIRWVPDTRATIKNLENGQCKEAGMREERGTREWQEVKEGVKQRVAQKRGGRKKKG